jgi:predicted alpha/beta superfamily hydrolase
LLHWLLITVTPTALAADHDAAIALGRQHVIESGILGEKRPIYVHLPQEYDNPDYAPRAYPVLYILDGDAHFTEAAGVVHFMSAGYNANMQIPELIVVAIPNTTDRTGDMTPTAMTTDYNGTSLPQPVGGRGDRFLDFMTQELRPFIDQRYRTLDFRVFAGHSWGGLINLYSLYRSPGDFHGYIAIDPGVVWDREYLLSYAGEHPPGLMTPQRRVYLSLAGDHQPGTPMRVTIERFVQSAAEQLSGKIDFRFEEIPGEDHGSVHLRSLYNGLLHVFSGFRPTYQQRDSMLSLQAHFDAITERFGFAYPVPEHMVERYARVYQGQGRLEEAEAFLRFNAKTYPQSAGAQKRLDAFLTAREPSAASEHVE